MSERKDNVEPAFPVYDHHGNGRQFLAGAGMTLRDYFIAHAPAEPQPWFKPTMPPRPEFPKHNTSKWTERERSDFSGYGVWLSLPEIESERVREAVTAIEAAKDAENAWCLEHDRARYIQWPAAWADAMLKERAK